MSAFLIRLGKVLAVNAEHSVLENYVKTVKKVKVSECAVLSYLNGFATLHIRYSDNAVGQIDGIDAAQLRDWSESHKGWPPCKVFNVQQRYMASFRPDLEVQKQVLEESVLEQAAEAAHYEPVVTVRRTRTRPGPGAKRITRTRKH